MTERAICVDVPGLKWSAGTPEPFLVSTEGRTVFAYYEAEHDKSDDLVLVAEFVGCTSVRFGFPNDEALGGHPLAQGLTYYATHEVLDSEWLEEVRAIERHHPSASAVPFPATRHWLLSFHDTTLEALAVGIEFRGSHPDRATATRAMLDLVSLA